MNNSIEVFKDNKTYVFVTRGRSKAFSSAEIADYFSDYNEVIRQDESRQSETWQVPDTKERKIMFLRDLKLGLKFCASKYAVSEEDVIRECRRIAPHMRLE